MTNITSVRFFRIATPVILAATLAACGSMKSNKSDDVPSTSASATTPSMASTKITAADQQYVNEIAYGNIAEISTAQLALTKSQNPNVRAFAQRMIDDHTRASKLLTTLVQSKGGIVPTETDLKHKAVALELGALSGNLFDKQYLSQAGVGDHKRTYELLQEVQKNANDPALRNFATSILPVVHSHLTEVQAMTGK